MSRYPNTYAGIRDFVRERPQQAQNLFAMYGSVPVANSSGGIDYVANPITEDVHEKRGIKDLRANWKSTKGAVDSSLRKILTEGRRLKYAMDTNRDGKLQDNEGTPQQRKVSNNLLMQLNALSLSSNMLGKHIDFAQDQLERIDRGDPWAHRDETTNAAESLYSFPVLDMYPKEKRAIYASKHASRKNPDTDIKPTRQGPQYDTDTGFVFGRSGHGFYGYPTNPKPISAMQAVGRLRSPEWQTTVGRMMDNNPSVTLVPEPAVGTTTQRAFVSPNAHRYSDGRREYGGRLSAYVIKVPPSGTYSDWIDHENVHGGQLSVMKGMPFAPEDIHSMLLEPAANFYQLGRQLTETDKSGWHPDAVKAAMPYQSLVNPNLNRDYDSFMFGMNPAGLDVVVEHLAPNAPTAITKGPLKVRVVD